MTDEQLRKEILVALEYSYLHDDWVFPLEEALAGITAEQALWRPAGDAKGIWDIVLHVAAWNENIVERIRTGHPTHPAEGAWPPVDPEAGSWEEAKERLRNSLALVRTEIETTPIDKLAAGPYGLGDLFCRFTHIAYHLGQITKLREVMADLSTANASGWPG